MEVSEEPPRGVDEKSRFRFVPRLWPPFSLSSEQCSVAVDGVGFYNPPLPRNERDGVMYGAALRAVSLS